MSESRLHQQRKQPTAGSWKPGQTGNPKGRPVASRQRLAEGMITDLAELWAEGGAIVLRHLMTNEPAKFAQLAFGILPREALISVSQSAPGGLDPESWQTLRAVLDLIQAHAPDGVAPAQVFELIENALRAEFANPVATIEHAPIPAPPY